ncbi:MAG: DUF4157 domain-containing protein [Candidatus Binatia bacterium]
MKSPKGKGTSCRKAEYGRACLSKLMSTARARVLHHQRSSATLSRVKRLFLFVWCIGLLGSPSPLCAAPPEVRIERGATVPPTAENWLSTLGTTMGPVLADAIRRGRDHAATTARPIPTKVRQELAPFFSAALLKKVRYSTDWQHTTAESALYSLLLATGAEAVTLGHVIIFRDAQHATNPVLWAHELTHVEQYERLGLAAFAAQYLQQGWQMEQEAMTKASTIQQKLAP